MVLSPSTYLSQIGKLIHSRSLVTSFNSHYHCNRS